MIHEHLISGKRLPPFVHLAYFNTEFYPFISDKTIEGTYQTVSSNVDVFKPFYKKFKKLRRRNNYGFVSSNELIKAIIKAIDDHFFEKYNYRGLRKEYNRRRKVLFGILYKKNKNCAKCSTTENLTVDHIKPLIRGGSNHISNLQILCRRCNSVKGSKIV